MIHKRRVQKMRNKRLILLARSFFAIIALILPFIVYSLEQAAPKAASKLVVYGKVQTINPGAATLTIRGILVRSNAATIAPIRSGMVVRVSGARRPDGTISASEIKRMQAGEAFSLL